MKTIRYKPATQQGASLYALIIVMTLLGIIILAGLKISSAYIDDQIVSSTLNNLRDNGELANMPLRDIRTRVSRTMQANGVSWGSDSIDQIEEGGVEYIAVQYETRVSMFWNIDAIVKFDYRIPKSN
jgi:hypothetical protein